MVVVAIAVSFTVWGVRRLAAWSRLPLQMISWLCVPFFPVGTILGVRILYLLTSGPGPHLLMKEYKQVVPADLDLIAVADDIRFAIQSQCHCGLATGVAYLLDLDDHAVSGVMA